METRLRPKVQTNSDWMSCLPEELLDVPLWNLAIPGSHDSMSFCLDRSSPVLRSEPRCLLLAERLCPGCVRACVSRWSTTQQSVLKDQCDLGIRFFDLRIARKPSSSRLFFAHGIYTLITVKEALDELASWLDAHPLEIVIICCSHFEGLTDQEHGHLVEFIFSLFNHKLCPSMSTPTLRSCRQKRQQLIVSYDNETMLQRHPELWKDIPYLYNFRYADSSDPKKVIAFLEDKKRQRPDPKFYVSGLNLTEDASYVLLHPFQNMRSMTAHALSVLLGWVEGQRAGPQKGAVNIICCDFVGISQFCSLVIELNYKLLGQTHVWDIIKPGLNPSRSETNETQPRTGYREEK
ncbi:PI-PLC X domain-containing protein 1-like isoform 1-T1 [Synchiropus picturatus]